MIENQAYQERSDSYANYIRVEGAKKIQYN